MASISRGERVLLGYDPDSLSSGRSSDVDFSDVFGGPPRRFSIQDSGNGSFDCVDYLGFGEKPVFGNNNEIGARRRYPSDDFYDDIFRVDSCSQSPRIMGGRDSYSSAPGSRVMSPSRPLPPSAEPILSPAKFSLPGRLASTDFVASPSATQGWSSPSSSTNSSRFNQTTQNLDVLHGDARLSYRPSPLSQKTSVDTKESPKKAAKLQDKPGFAKDSKVSAVPIDSTQFHFSIYKWASKGVPLVMSVKKESPSRSKERVKIDRSLSATERGRSDILVAENQTVDIPDHQSRSFRSSNGSILHSKSIDSQICDDLAWEISKALSNSNSSSLQSTEKQAQADVDFHGLEEPRESHSSPDKGFILKQERKVTHPKSPVNTRKFNINTLGSLLQEKNEGDENVMAEKGGKERKLREKEKPSLADFLPSRKVNKTKAESFREPKDDPRRGEGAGSKVKDFVKIFNQESSSKIKKNVQGQSQSCRWKDTHSTFEDDSDINTTTKTNEEEHVSSVNWETTPTEVSEMADGDSFLLGKQQYDVSSSDRDSATPTPALTNEPIIGGVRDHAPNVKATLEDDILTKNSIQDINIQAEVENKDETKSYENKVRKWSKGKEGNIRSLLSTLQYVLWPNSGWKPVPLVDIIEANAVKRAYQRALLCLHPDKLQQKGAAPHQKFIAEKVFDVLQEAWDHFNSLGTI